MRDKNWYERFGKRALDLSAAVPGLVVLSPLMLCIAAAVKLLDPGPVFFRQRRAGLGFAPFTIYKFRSMRVGGSGLQITKDGDGRVTALGRLLRKTKLDELPQLFNVVRGDMSLVGPRPTVPKYAEMFRAEYELILSLKPGITDYASIKFRDEEGVLKAYEEPEAGYMDDILPQKIALYRRYIEEMGPLTDLKILLATVAKVLGRGRKAESGEGPVLIKPRLARERRLLMLALDLAVVLGAYAAAFFLHSDFGLGAFHRKLLGLTAPYAVLSYLAASHYFGVNRGLRYYASFGDSLDTLKAVACAGLLHAFLLFMSLEADFPRPVLVLWPLLSLIGVAGLHAFIHGARHYFQVRLLGRCPTRAAVIVGVGDLGELVYQNMRSDEAVDYRVVAFVDDARAKCSVRLHGVPVVGASGLPGLLSGAAVDEIIIAVSRDRRGKAVGLVSEALHELEKRPVVRVMPALDELLKTTKSAEPRKVQASDLLNRSAIPLDTESIGRSVEGKTVLVTGAGGTIGGELCRQLLNYRPKKVILLDNHASALFYRESELRQNAGVVELAAALGDVRDLSVLDRIFHEDRPQIVLHAAAHKHVYQLENNVHEGVSNNLLATYHLAGLADRAGVETFILISTDKADSPTCVMGATKRAAEIVVSNFARASKTRFSSVRFGSVLGTTGSVLKIFQEQIEKGRPLTLTHSEAARYFMTVEEAAGLILQASALARGGEIFNLKMGEQIRVMEMARSLVRLSGLDPDRDVQFRFIGLNPGENPLELAEGAASAAGLDSEHPGITVLPPEPAQLDAMADRILSLEVLSYTAGKDAMVRALCQLVPAFTPPSLVPRA